MRTQCPDCKAKFKVSEKNSGKKAKCPKCGQPFTIEPFVEIPIEAQAKNTVPEKTAEEVCSGCETVIDSQKQAFVHKGSIFCEQCYNKIKGAQTELATDDKPIEEKSKSKKLSKTLYVYLWAAVRIIAGGFCVLGLMLTVRTKANSMLIAIFAVGNVFLICSVSIELMLYYKMWAAIQDNRVSVSAAKAVGFLFIPVFNIYWALYMLVGFAEDYNVFIQRKAVRAKDLSLMLFLVYAVVFLLSSIAVTIPMVCIFGYIDLVRKAFFSYSFMSWLLFFFVLAIGVSHFLIYIAFAIKTCKAINALPEAK